MKIIFKNFNTAPFISKKLATLEREIIQVIINFDSTVYNNDFFQSYRHIWDQSSSFNVAVYYRLNIFSTISLAYTPFLHNHVIRPSSRDFVWRQLLLLLSVALTVRGDCNSRIPFEFTIYNYQSGNFTVSNSETTSFISLIYFYKPPKSM
jgi:hypothetical protein